MGAFELVVKNRAMFNSSINFNWRNTEFHRIAKSLSVVCILKAINCINMGSLNFGKDTAEDKYASFLSEYDEYIADDLSISKAQRLAVSAWHLVDWTFENHRSKHNFTDLGAFRESLYPLCESLKIIHDLANAAKHLTVTRQKGDIRDTRKHLGRFSTEFSDEFDISSLEIEKNNGTKLSFRREIAEVRNFWDGYFK